MSHTHNEPISTGRKRLAMIIMGVIAFVAIIVVVASSMVIVQPGHRGVVLTFGEVNPVPLGEGIHTITPVAQSVIQLEVRTQKYEASAGAASKDLQDAKTTVALNYHIDPPKTALLYQNLGEGFADKVIAPTIQESVKSTTAKYNAVELIQQRELVKAAIGDVIRKELSTRDLIIEQIFITDFQFSPGYQQQIEAKQIAQQEAETQKNILDSKRVQAEQRVVEAAGLANASIERARGESESIRLINIALAENPQYLQWQMLNKWSGNLPMVMGSDGLFPLIDISSLSQQPLPKQ